MLQNLSKKWLVTQLTHEVSAAATNSFWQLSTELFQQLFEAKARDDVSKNIPGFIHLRRKLYKDSSLSPKIYMKFVFLNKTTNAIETVHCERSPSRQYSKANYIKLYEEAHVKVRHICVHSSQFEYYSRPTLFRLLNSSNNFSPLSYFLKGWSGMELI